MEEDFDKDRFDALMELADFRFKRVTNRRQFEWKVTVGIWAVLAAGIVSSKAQSQPLTQHQLIFPLIALVFGHAFLWVGSHWVRSTADLKFAFYYAERAETRLLPNSGINVRDRPKRPEELPCCERLFGFLRGTGVWFQIGATALLAYGFFLVAPPL